MPFLAILANAQRTLYEKLRNHENLAVMFIGSSFNAFREFLDIVFVIYPAKFRFTLCLFCFRMCQRTQGKLSRMSQRCKFCRQDPPHFLVVFLRKKKRPK